MGEYEPCGHKCLNPELPVWGPWGGGPFGNHELCISEEHCTTSGPILESAKHMCNGLCIPAIIPCNNTCLDQVEWAEGRFERLYGPVTCYGAIWRYPDSRDFFTESLPSHVLTEVRDIIGHTDSEFGLCLPGSIGCNGTCTLDPDRPHVKAGSRVGEMECSDVIK